MEFSMKCTRSTLHSDNQELDLNLGINRLLATLE